MLTNRLIAQLQQQNSKQIPVKEKHGSALGEQSENNCHKSILLETLCDQSEKNCHKSILLETLWR